MNNFNDIYICIYIYMYQNNYKIYKKKWKNSVLF